MTSSCWGEVIAAMIFIGSPQVGQSSGSESHTFLMSFAQVRLRARRNSSSSSSRAPLSGLEPWSPGAWWEGSRPGRKRS